MTNAAQLVSDVVGIKCPKLAGKEVVISCAANEFHQVGGKMVADVFEMHGRDSHFLGANTPVEELLGYIQESDPVLHHSMGKNVLP